MKAQLAIILFTMVSSYLSLGAELALPKGNPWPRHTIDAGYRGSDGTKVADINGDQLPDITTAWENEGVTRVYLHPGFERVKSEWPAVTIGSTPKAEDALFVDLDLDGAIDVVTSQEKRSERVLVHWAPRKRSDLLNSNAWMHAEFTAVTGVTMWMFAQSIQLEGSSGRDLVVGGKNYEKDQSSWIGLLLAPKQNRREAKSWTWKPLARVSWTMSIEVLDMNGDGRDDILYSDKNGPAAGIWWLEQPASENGEREWKRHRLTPPGLNGSNFLAVGDLDGDGLKDVVGSIDLQREPNAPDHAHRRIMYLRRLDSSGMNWQTHEILVPPGVAQPKAVTVGDVNQDGQIDLVVTSTGAERDLIGTYWLEYLESPYEKVWKAHNIAGPAGEKYDLVHLIDLDGDGDLDVLTSEENEGPEGDGPGLGVFWYENILKARLP